MSAARNVLILGGAGFIGSAIAARLVARGHRVTVPARRRERARHLLVLPTVEVIEADIADHLQLAALMRGQDAVIFLPGILHSRVGKPYGPDFKAVHVDLVERAVNCAVAAGVPRFLHMSSLGASPHAPSMYGRSKASGEAQVQAVKSQIATTIFRPSVVFGAGDKFTNLFALMQRVSPLVILGRADAKLQPIHVEDVASAFVTALDNPDTFHQTYELAGPTAYTLRELVGLCGKWAGVARPVIGLPDSLAYAQALAMEWLPIKLLSRDNLDALKEDNVMRAPLAPELSLSPVTLESAAPAWLAPHGSAKLRYDSFRQKAHR